MHFVQTANLIRLLLILISLWLPIQGIAQSTDIPRPDIPVEIEFSEQGGFYPEDVVVELNSPGAKMYYTLDGTTPTKKSELYEFPLLIEETTVLRVKAYKGRKDSKVQAHTYFINEPPSTFPTVAITVDPWMLFDPEVGLFMNGPDAIDSLWRMPGANFWSKSERNINTEIFEDNGECVFRSPTGFRLFGGMSRLFPQKSMTLVCRNIYGKKRIRHKLFGKKGAKKFKFLVLRNSGSDWGKSHFRDAFMTDLVDKWDMETQDERPTQVYINGNYWGIYHIREKVNRYFLETEWGFHKDSIDLIEHKLTRKRGSRKHYQRMLDFLEDNDMSLSENYSYIQSQMDVENFIDYKIAEIYFDNVDAGGNIKYWRPQIEGGKWRWILYDTDWGYGLHDPKAYKTNSLKFHTEPKGPHWPNPPWSTFILRSLLDNQEFKTAFITRFADHLNDSFSPERALRLIDKHYQRLLPEMPKHLKRWELSNKTWNREVGVMQEFAAERPSYVRTHLMDKFDIGRQASLNLTSSAGGKIVLNRNVEINSGDNFTGTYFEKIPVHLLAEPDLGYKFSHWEGVELLDGTRELSIALLNDVSTLRAVFEKAINPLTGVIVINEISCNNNKTGDWVELYNHSRESVDLKDWFVADNRNKYKLPSISIPGRSYTIICQDTAKFAKVFPDVDYINGNLGYGLSKRREKINLYDAEGASVDKFQYDIRPRDSIFTLNLLLPNLDNADIENWEALVGNGSPGRPNAYYLESRIQATQELWVRLGAAAGIILVLLFMLMRKKRQMAQYRT